MPLAHLREVIHQQQYGREWFDDEAPQHIREIPAFRIDRTPVTNIDFHAFVTATGYRTGAEARGFGLMYGATYWQTDPRVCWHTPAPGIDAVTDRPEHPVLHVNVSDAEAYARWAGKRLPTEIEWEYAAHGPAWAPYPWGADWNADALACAEHWAGTLHNLDEWSTWWRARYSHQGPNPGTTPVGAFSPIGDSPYGVADMAGNVAEWTASEYTPYACGTQIDPALSAAMLLRYRVVRGGGWKHMRWQTRTTERIACVSNYSSFEIGFRCAADDRPNTTPEGYQCA
ncbi:formylglycine-generating enzyme family protein [Nocardia jejuensis]|uniref:formylglycine-generating enzyme family protein n=1 Tax=Nocardia jejuensis TaxID=328049 RepID=UPI001471E25D|nr:SUMF1/EgtB/PvdO family nonheme iron enzyme [Nocardia jejuensis]